ncbi:MAG: hypothetical protein MUE50_13085 [Pirellulaceae bacterium]|nr:hypothetical protein [Pirellulaceae bacterium]
MRSCILHAPAILVFGLAAAVGTSGITASDEPAGGSAAPPASAVRKTIPEENLRIPEQVQSCATNLKKVHAAIKKYEQNKGTVPDWLSDLVPDYLENKDLLCPIHGKVIAAYWPDPKLPCSYTYEFSATRLTNNWGAVSGMVCRDWKTKQVKLFGDVVPMIRCFHQPYVLSLTSGGQVFWGLEVWERVFMPSYQRGDELEPSERPFRYIVPTGGVDELVKFIEEVRALRPRTPFQTLDHEQTAPAALKAAATRILGMETDEWSTAYQTALRILLADRIRLLDGQSPAGQRETLAFVKSFLTAKLERSLAREDVEVAQEAAKKLEDLGNPQLAVEAYRDFGRLLAKSKDQAAADAAKQMEAAAKRLQP